MIYEPTTSRPKFLPFTESAAPMESAPQAHTPVPSDISFHARKLNPTAERRSQPTKDKISKKNDQKLTIVDSSAYSLSLSLSQRQVDIWKAWCCYGPSEFSAKRRFWAQLTELVQQADDDWICQDDFNEIVS